MLAALDIFIIFGQYVFLSITIYLLLNCIPIKSQHRLLYRAIWGWKKFEPSDTLMKWLKIDRKAVIDSELAIVFNGCGFEFSIFSYVIARKIGLAIIVLTMSLYVSLTVYGQIALSLITTIAYCMVSMFIFSLLYWDIYFLKMYRELRAVTITKELYAISHQLLYFQDSALHLHSKLRRCLPYSRLLRKDLEILLADWYHDPAGALHMFKQRIGTAEGISFVETLDALRLQHHDSFYDMLRTHIRDYKERIDLAKESRKETNSYVLFVIAGIPILFTFQVFLYPWVQEVNKLLSLLN